MQQGVEGWHRGTRSSLPGVPRSNADLWTGHFLKKRIPLLGPPKADHRPAERVDGLLHRPGCSRSRAAAALLGPRFIPLMRFHSLASAGSAMNSPVADVLSPKGLGVDLLRVQHRRPRPWLHQMLAGLPAPEREEAWIEIASALAAYEGPDGFVGPGEMLVVTATR